jgi:anti-sigma regulatory factor (Ser/Thr protein kinase)
MRTRIRLTAEAEQLALARAWLQEWAWPALAGRPALVDDLVIVANELCSNAVRHGGAPITLTVALQAGRVRISVRNRATTPVAIGSGASPAGLDSGGRGLQLVARLSRAWGWRSGDGTALVWAELEGPGARTRG